MFCTWEIFQFIFVYHSHVKQSIRQYFVGSRHRFFRQWNLLQVEQRILFVDGRCVGSQFRTRSSRLQALAVTGYVFVLSTSIADRVSFCCRFIVIDRVEVIQRNHGFISSSPVILQFAASPQTLEICFTLCHQLWIIEIPGIVSGRDSRLCGSRSLRSIGSIFGSNSFTHGVPFGLFCQSFFFLFFLNNPCYQCIDYHHTGSTVQWRQMLQTVLQFYRSSERHQLIKYFRTSCELFIFRMCLVQQPGGISIGRLCFGIAAHLPAKIA